MLSPASLMENHRAAGVVLGIPDTVGNKCETVNKQQEGKCGWSHVSEGKWQKISERQEALDHVRPCLDFILNVTGSHWRL